MRGPGAEIGPYADCLVLIGPQADGPVLGFYAGHPIAAAVVDDSGRRYVYAGVVPRRHTGRYDFTALGPDEWVVDPGLIYARAIGNPDDLLAKSHDRFARGALGNLKEVVIGWLH
jgi:hypothetical protein